jgi:hypothetical protein
MDNKVLAAMVDSHSSNKEAMAERVHNSPVGVRMIVRFRLAG